jgi:CRISPR-associated protein Cas1
MKTKNVKIALEGFGELLGREKGCLVVKDRKGKHKRYPLFENAVSEIQIRTGNLVSSGALATCAFWNVNVIVLTQYGNPIAVLKSLNDDDHVKTRICQYEALKNGKGLEAAKQIVLAKIRGQNELLKKYGLKWLDYYPYSQAVKAIDDRDITRARARLMSYEGRFSEQYFRQIFALFNEAFRPEKRKTFKAYDGLNNVFNVSYRVLSWKVHLALIKAKLEPYLGFLHAIQFGLPSLVCDFEDLYRYLVDDFLIGFCQSVRAKDFVLKSEDYSGSKKGKRQYLDQEKNRELVNGLNRYFEAKVSIPRIKRGSRQEIETLINEEALLFASYLRNEKDKWTPRVVSLR